MKIPGLQRVKTGRDGSVILVVNGKTYTKSGADMAVLGTGSALRDDWRNADPKFPLLKLTYTKTKQSTALEVGGEN